MNKQLNFPLGIELASIDTKLSRSRMTAIAVVTLTTGFDMVGSAQFTADVTSPTSVDEYHLRVAAVKDAIDKIVDIANQERDVQSLFYSLL